jgi:acetolactate synthase-1/2/3 large subunit
MCTETRPALAALNKGLDAAPLPEDHFAGWQSTLKQQAAEHPMLFPDLDNVIVPQRAIQMLHEETNGNAVITTGVGQHQMWAAQWYDYDQPRHWATSGGLGSMGFGLPSALGAAAALEEAHRETKVVVDIDGDGSFLMNIQELATVSIDKLPTKMFILNNQHLGMVVQWEDRFYKANRAHTYLGRREAEYHETHEETDIYPDFVTIARGFGVPSKRVRHPSELRAAIREMLDTPGPYLLDVMVPHIEHVLPMIPGGGSFKDIITKGDGSVTY